MSITTLAGASANLTKPKYVVAKTSAAPGINNFMSLWYATGSPAAGVLDSSTAGGVARTSPVTGQIPFQNPASGNTYVAGLQILDIGVARHPILLTDRLWDCGANSGGSAIDVTSTSPQTINSVALPSRDRSASANGDGVFIIAEAAATLGAALTVGNATISYTNSAGTSGRTGTATYAMNTTVGSATIFGLQAGDVGVKSIQSLTLGNSLVSGSLSLAAVRVIQHLDVFFDAARVDPLTGGFPRLFDGSVPFFMGFTSANTAFTLTGELLMTQG